MGTLRKKIAVISDEVTKFTEAENHTPNSRLHEGSVYLLF